MKIAYITHHEVRTCRCKQMSKRQSNGDERTADQLSYTLTSRMLSTRSAIEAKGFLSEDIALFKRMYTGSFLVMANRFGRSAACVLSRGVAQGAPPSPRIFGLTFDPVHSVVQESRRGCTLQGAIEPTGSSGFADDTPLHTDGPDAVPAMVILVTKTADYLQWAGMDIHLKNVE
jgi:hypothetical protein